MNKQISAVEASTLQKDENVVFLDIREGSELAICQIEGALHIPLREITQRYDTLPRNSTIIVFCHYGMRSLKAQNFLISLGLQNVISMQGGIDAWATDVDPQVPKY